MKWWNKKKGRDNWTKVRVPISFWVRGPQSKGVDLLVWCKQQPGTGKFYYYHDQWWFEKPEDASYFLLKWS